jgi:hypothetical protein
MIIRRWQVPSHWQSARPCAIQVLNCCGQAAGPLACPVAAQCAEMNRRRDGCARGPVTVGLGARTPDTDLHGHAAATCTGMRGHLHHHGQAAATVTDTLGLRVLPGPGSP